MVFSVINLLKDKNIKIIFNNKNIKRGHISILKDNFFQELNFYADKIIFEKQFCNIYLNQSELKKIEDLNFTEYNKKVYIEFGSVNPTGLPTIANFRNICIGEFFSRIVKYCKGNIYKEYYFNDKGNQVEKLFENNDSYLRVKKEFKGKLNIQEIKKNIINYLQKYDIYFDNYISEIELYNLYNINNLKLNILNQNGRLLIESNNKQKYLNKKDFSNTYLYSDLLYILHKKSMSFDRYIICMGIDHLEYADFLRPILKENKLSVDFLLYDLAKIQLFNKTIKTLSKRNNIDIRPSDYNLNLNELFFIFLRSKNSLVKSIKHKDLIDSKRFVKKILEYIKLSYITPSIENEEYQLFLISFLKLNYLIHVFLQTFEAALLFETIEFMISLKKYNSKISRLFSDFVSKIFLLE